MNAKLITYFLSFFPIFLLSIQSSSSSNPDLNNFTQCFSQNSPHFTALSTIIFTPANSSYSTLLQSSIPNLRFTVPPTRKPFLLITPLVDSHVQATVICCRKYGLQIRIRRSGHDYEGLSSTSTSESELQFVVLDLANIRSIAVDVEDSSAWVVSGETVGELYYRIAEKSPVHGFPVEFAPRWPPAGISAQADLGTKLRKHGVAADNIVDARIVDVNGRILDRKSMGEELFWAIRGGGGGASFGVILSWKIKLVKVPPIVSVFNIPRTLNQYASFSTSGSKSGTTWIQFYSFGSL